MRKFLASLWMLLSAMVGISQDLADEFKRFRSDQEQEFLEERRRQDSIFAAEIRKNWKSFELNEPYEHLPEYPKPEAQPENDEELVPRNYQAKPQNQKLRTFEPIEYEHLDYYPEEDKLASFNFYGQECELNYPSGLLFASNFEASNDYVADFWSLASKKPYQKVVNDLIVLKKELNIPGYGFSILIDDFAKNLDVSDNESKMYHWFLLTKAGYNARVGFSNGRPLLIVASEMKIYGKPYFEEEGVTYYVLDDQARQIETYGKVATQASSALDFVFEEAPDLPLSPKSKQFQFVHGGTEYSWEIYYNMNVVNLLEDFPLVELPAYFNSRGSFLLERSLKKQLSEDLKNMTETEAVSLMLSFTQKAFEYQTDQLQFGIEKIMYPDEFIHFDKSDCDDRVVFMNYLIDLFTDVKTVALLFPQHIALGAKLPLPAYGETVDYAGNRFTFCDPTFYNAPLGTVIPQADRSKMEVLSF